MSGQILVLFLLGKWLTANQEAPRESPNIQLTFCLSINVEWDTQNHSSPQCTKEPLPRNLFPFTSHKNKLLLKQERQMWIHIFSVAVSHQPVIRLLWRFFFLWAIIIGWLCDQVVFYTIGTWALSVGEGFMCYDYSIFIPCSLPRSSGQQSGFFHHNNYVR